jgi:hypothetical protein
MLSILQIQVITVFMIDPDIPMLISKFTEKGYITARIRTLPEGVGISFIEPPNIIAGKGTIKVNYDFGRKALGIESPNFKEISACLDEIWNCLKEINVDIEKALIPYEVTIIGEAFLKPKFSDNKYIFKNLFDFDLKLMEAGLIGEGKDPNSNEWFYLKLSPIWSSYKIDEKSLYRITIVYRDKKTKIINFIENIESNLKNLLKEL